MLKYIMIILSLYTPLQCMHSLIEQQSDSYFKNATVLSYDGWQSHAIFIAKSANLVHSNIQKTDAITHTIQTPTKHPEIKNLFFREPQHNTYDLITVYNPYMFNTNNILIHLKSIHNYLTLSGKLHFFIRTQSNDIPVAEQAFATIYSQISTVKPQSNYTDQQLKDIIWANGYNIDLYENKTYETVITNEYEYKETLKATFMYNIRHCNLPETKIQNLKEQFAELVIQRSKKNDLGQLIESWNFTKIVLCKADKLRPPVFLNNSLLPIQWT